MTVTSEAILKFSWAHAFTHRLSLRLNFYYPYFNVNFFRELLLRQVSTQRWLAIVHFMADCLGIYSFVARSLWMQFGLSLSPDIYYCKPILKIAFIYQRPHGSVSISFAFFTRTRKASIRSGRCPCTTKVFHRLLENTATVGLLSEISLIAKFKYLLT